MTIEQPAKIVEKFDLPLWGIKGSNMFRMLSDLRKYKGINACYVSGEKHHFITYDKDFDIEKLKKHLENSGYEQLIVEKTQPTIEDCYMRLALS